MTAQSFGYIRAYNFYKDGFLPNPGGWMEQPVKLIEALMYIQRIVNEKDKDQSKQNQ